MSTKIIKNVETVENEENEETKVTEETEETEETEKTVETVYTEDLKKYDLLTHLMTDNLKARDASASKKITNHSRGQLVTGYP